MPKFSIIIPVYNVEKYINKCLESVFNQTEDDYEVIVVNDGTQDKSIELIKDYNIKIINQKNQGLSQARNKGAKLAKGEYLIFLDSDDYLEKDTLKEIKKSLKNKPDLVRFQIREVYEDGKTIDYQEESFTNKSGVEAFKLITKYHFVENAWCYAIKNEYYKKEKYEFLKETYHEDFGLLPLVILKANIVNSISYIGYNYFQRQGSIMNNCDYSKTKKKVDDMMIHYNFLLKEGNKTKLDTTYFKSFISNSLILKITELNKKDYKEYKNKLKQEKVYDNLLEDTFSRKIKKIIIKISPKIYHKVISR